MNRVSEAVLLFLVNASWQVTLVALLASAGDRVLRDAKARYRHVLWVLALASSLVLPGSVFLPSASAPIRDSSTGQRAQTRLVDGAGPEPTSANPGPDRITKNWASIWIGMKMPVLRVGRAWAIAALLLYVISLLYRAGKFWRAWMRTRAVVRSAVPIKVSARLKDALARCELILDLKHVRVLSSNAVAMPSAVRSLRPLIILPAYLLAEDDLDLMTSSIGHEAAHIARHDYLMNLIYELASLPLWFHPAITLLLRRIRQSRELCCDEIVAERLMRPSVYAQSLVQLAAASLPGSRSSATIAVGIADADILEERIMSILNYSPPTSRRWPQSAIAASLLVIPCVAAGAFAVQVSVRQAANSAAVLQVNASGNVPIQPSASRQQSSGTSGMSSGRHILEAQPKAPPAPPERRDTVLIVSKRVNSQEHEGAASKTPGSHVDERHIGTGKGLGVGGGPVGGVGGGVSGGVVGGVGSTAQGPQNAKPEHSEVTEGNLIQLIEPVYPEEAVAAGIEGDVVFKATLGKTGNLENLRTIISGDPALQAAALDAVKQWKYEPYRFNSEPVEIKATITFKFRLAE